MIHISLLPKRTAKQRLFLQKWLIKWLCSCGMYCSLRWSPSRESVAIALLPALSSKHSNSLMKPCGSFYHPVCWPRGRQIKIEEREEGLREREKGENNQRRKDKKNIEGVQKMRVVGAQVRRNKWVFQRKWRLRNLCDVAVLPPVLSFFCQITMSHISTTIFAICNYLSETPSFGGVFSKWIAASLKYVSLKLCTQFIKPISMANISWKCKATQITFFNNMKMNCWCNAGSYTFTAYH